MSRTKFTIDTDLKKTKSPLNAEFIDAYLETKRNGELSGIGKDVMKAAEKYEVNATYIVAHAALESGWGTSRIAKEKNNLFGWQAFDDSPYESAKSFPSRAECIDFVINRINELYLTPGGRYFRKAACLGRGGKNGHGMNASYTTDPTWGTKIARIADDMELAFEKTVVLEDSRVSTASESAKPNAGSFTVDDLLDRARSAVGRRIRYELGKGGMHPSSPLPSTSGACDCSGFVCWCLRLSRKTDHPLYLKLNGGWINTDSIVKDAEQQTGFFYRIEHPRVGCIAVYPGRRSRKGAWLYGHVGIITQVNNKIPQRVIHCSGGNYKNHGDAILETDFNDFEKNNPIFAWYVGLVE